MSIKVTLKMLVPFPTFRNKFWISKPLLFLSILMLQILFTEEQLSKSVWDILLFIIVYLTVNNWFVMIYNKPYLETLLPLNFSFFFCLLAHWLLVFDFLFSGFLSFFFFLIIIERLVYFYIELFISPIRLTLSVELFLRLSYIFLQ